MKKLILSIIALLVCAASVYAAGTSAGFGMIDANGAKTSLFGLDSTKTITATVTGTKPAFADTTLATGTYQLQVNCVNPATGAAAAARIKINNAGTEIPVNGVTGPFIVPASALTLAFGKYSTGTATDSVKCTAYGQ